MAIYNQELLATSYSDCTLQVTNLELQPIFSNRIQAHNDRINAIQFCPASSDILYSCSSDHTLHGWDIRSPHMPICRLTLNSKKNTHTI